MQGEYISVSNTAMIGAVSVSLNLADEGADFTSLDGLLAWVRGTTFKNVALTVNVTPATYDYTAAAPVVLSPTTGLRSIKIANTSALGAQDVIFNVKGSGTLFQFDNVEVTMDYIKFITTGAAAGVKLAAFNQCMSVLNTVRVDGYPAGFALAGGAMTMNDSLFTGGGDNGTDCIALDHGASLYGLNLNLNGKGVSAAKANGITAQRGSVVVLAGTLAMNWCIAGLKQLTGARFINGAAVTAANNTANLNVTVNKINHDGGYISDGGALTLLT